MMLRACLAIAMSVAAFAVQAQDPELLHNPNRPEFLRWLSNVALRIPPETLKEVLGDTIVPPVPCGSLDLTS